MRSVPHALADVEPGKVPLHYNTASVSLVAPAVVRVQQCCSVLAAKHRTWAGRPGWRRPMCAAPRHATPRQCHADSRSIGPSTQSSCPPRVRTGVTGKERIHPAAPPSRPWVPAGPQGPCDLFRETSQEPAAPGRIFAVSFPATAASAPPSPRPIQRRGDALLAAAVRVLSRNLILDYNKEEE